MSVRRSAPFAPPQVARVSHEQRLQASLLGMPALDTGSCGRMHQYRSDKAKDKKGKGKKKDDSSDSESDSDDELTKKEPPYSRAEYEKSSDTKPKATGVSPEERARLYKIEKRPKQREGETDQMYEVRMVVRVLKQKYGTGDAPNGYTRVAAALKHYLDEQDVLTLLANPGELLDEVRDAFQADQARMGAVLSRTAVLEAQITVMQKQYAYWSAQQDMLIAGGGKANQQSAMSRDPAKATEAKDLLDSLTAQLQALKDAQAPYVFTEPIFPEPQPVAVKV